MTETQTYFIGGIATDVHLYAYQLKAVPNSVYLPFHKHIKGETLAEYALRFADSINIEEPFNIVANSMGGMMTMELIKHIKPQKTILLSSVKCRKEMPWRLRQLKYTGLHKLLPGVAFKAGVRYGSKFLREINKTPGMRDIVVQMARNNAPEFLYWCVNAIVNWNGAADYNNDIIHIHGTKDKMFPIKNISGAIPVEGGSHNMLLTEPERITQLLLDKLAPGR